MTTFVGSRKFEIVQRYKKDGSPEFFAQTHCHCGASFTSGEYLPSIGAAVREAREGFDAHEKTGKHMNKIDTTGALDGFVHTKTGNAQRLVCTCGERIEWQGKYDDRLFHWLKKHNEHVKG